MHSLCPPDNASAFSAAMAITKCSSHMPWHKCVPDDGQMFVGGRQLTNSSKLKLKVEKPLFIFEMGTSLRYDSTCANGCITKPGLFDELMIKHPWELLRATTNWCEDEFLKAAQRCDRLRGCGTKGEAWQSSLARGKRERARKKEEKKKRVLQEKAVSVSLNTAPTLFLRTYYAASDCFVDYCWDPQV